MDNFFSYVAARPLLVVFCVLLLLGGCFMLGSQIAKRNSRLEKIWFYVFIIGGVFMASQELSSLIILGTPLLFFVLGYVWIATREYRGNRIANRRLSAKERDSRRHEIRLAKASHSSGGQPKEQFSLAAVSVQVISGVAVWFVTDYFFEFGTTEATGSGFVTAAILGLVFKQNS